MAGSREDVAHDVVRLWGEGVSARAIARSLRIARKTVKKMLAERDKDRREGRPALLEPTTRVQRPSLLDP